MDIIRLMERDEPKELSIFEKYLEGVTKPLSILEEDPETNYIKVRRLLADGRTEIKEAVLNPEGKPVKERERLHEENGILHSGSIVEARGDMLVAIYNLKDSYDRGVKTIVLRAANKQGFGFFMVYHNHDLVFSGLGAPSVKEEKPLGLFKLVKVRDEWYYGFDDIFVEFWGSKIFIRESKIGIGGSEEVPDGHKLLLNVEIKSPDLRFSAFVTQAKDGSFTVKVREVSSGQETILKRNPKGKTDMSWLWTLLDKVEDRSWIGCGEYLPMDISTTRPLPEEKQDNLS